MRIWAMIRKDHRIVEQYEYEMAEQGEWNEANAQVMLGQVCEALDLERPILLPKHIQQLNRYNKAVFQQSDFVDSILFDQLDVEVLDGKKSQPDERAALLNDFSGLE